MSHASDELVKQIVPCKTNFVRNLSRFEGITSRTSEHVSGDQCGIHMPYATEK